MKGRHYTTRYSSIVPRGQRGICVDVDDRMSLLKIKFFTGEVYWFLGRDLKGVAE